MNSDIDALNASGIYEIKNVCNNKKYIGQSIHVRTRLLRHRCELIKNQHRNKHLQASWNKYGKDNFIFDVLEYCNVEQLDEKEGMYIETLNSNDPEYGYNHRVDNCSNRGLKWSEEQREKMMEAIDRNPWFKNHQIPKETQEKAWEATRNRIWTEEQRRRHSKIMTGIGVSDTSKMKLAQQGEKNPSSKLSEDEVREIICLCQKRYCHHEKIANVYDVSLGTVNSISANRTWTHIDRSGIDGSFYTNGVDRVWEYDRENKMRIENE